MVDVLIVIIDVDLNCLNVVYVKIFWFKVKLVKIVVSENRIEVSI